ncbi:MAG TPA: DNA-3-methyladenine glycosylase [Candidatus Limnocylindrales bacterium]
MTAPAVLSIARVHGPPLARDFYARPVVELARALLGCVLVSQAKDGLTAGRIVEAEAYAGPDDRASHARAGLTARTAPMFGPPGHAYVYLVYGMHECLNIVGEVDGRAGAVLLRALEPLAGVELMRRRRSRPTDPASRLAAGPARLAQALGVTRADNGHDLTLGRRLWLAAPEAPPDPTAIASGPRIGVGYAGAEWSARPWRLWLRDSAAVSRR